MNRFVLALALFVAACSAPASPPPPLEGARIGGPFSLTDQNGATVTDRSFAGQYRIMYFGYAYCPDVCPVDVANLARGMKAFVNADPAKGKKLKFIFVTVDPVRDTPKVLKDFVNAFDPNMVALTGPTAVISEVAKAYGVAYSVPPNQPKDSYLVDHSRQAYLMSPDNKPIVLLPHDGTSEEIAAELAKWVR
jgi:protein SCO1